MELPETLEGFRFPESLNRRLQFLLDKQNETGTLTADDPETGADIGLFSPRRDTFYEHFRWNGVVLVGLTPKGRATVAALAMNRARVLEIRHEGSLAGRHPPPDIWPSDIAPIPEE